MKKGLFTILAGLFICISGFSQEENEKYLKFSGYVKSDFFYDTRQVVAAREGHFLLYPQPVKLDPDGVDIYDHASLTMLALQSRVTAKFGGVTAMGAKLTGVVEGDFFGQANDNIHLFRLRHAFVKMSWSNTSILAGQYWHPLFVTSNFPGTISFNTGTPMQPFNRAPQLRLVQKAGPIEFMVAALSQRDYSSLGLSGKSGDYIRLTVLPEVQARLSLKVGSPESSQLITGFGVGFKNIKTTGLVTDSGYVSDQKVKGMSVNYFLNVKTQAITFKTSAVFMQNGTDYLSISGFAALPTPVDANRGIYEYVPIKNFALWGELHSTLPGLNFGVFGGYAKTLGTTETIDPNLVYISAKIDNLIRVSPRIYYTEGPFTLAFEGEYTSAAWGTPDDHAKIISTKETTTENIRILTSFIYKF
jgi:hypothetical protein